MKASKIFIGLLIIIVAVFSLMGIMSKKSVSVSAKPIETEEFTPYVSVSGTVRSSLSENGMAYVYTMVSESGISDIKIGQKAVITGNGFKNKSYNATVTNIDSSAKKINIGTAKLVAVGVTLKIDNPDNDLKSGFTAKAKIFTDKKSKIFTVPYSAIMVDGKKEYVYVVENSKAVKRYIKTGRELQNGYEVLSGINKNDRVIINPRQIKKDGTSVSAQFN